MADKLTAEQQAVVDNRGRSLLVSAAAGSGKTKVLVERLFSYVENEGANLDDFLIITYTRAAAAELRGKIAKALAEKLQNDPGNRHLQQQMLRVYRADIKTVDAFCTALLRENCHLLKEDENGRILRPDFRVLDEKEELVLEERVLSRVLDEFYETLDENGAQLADTLGAGRDDRALAALVMQLYKKLQAQPYMDRWLAEQKVFWQNVPERIEDTPYGEILLGELRRKCLYWAKVMQNGIAQMACSGVLGEKCTPQFADIAAQLLRKADVTDWDAAGAPIIFPRFATVRNYEDTALKTQMKTIWDNCKDSMKKLDAVFSVSAADAIEDIRAVSGAMTALLDLTENFYHACQTEKRRRNAADFSDQEHEAIRLLRGADGQPNDLARAVSERYREIMVDEYQDTNEVQNCIFEAISREGKNLFTVGDVKQSIYRFRLADPRIFLDHYTHYPPAAQAQEGEAGKLLLTKNFRSRAEVLEATNYVFTNILSRDMGELDYGEDEALHYGEGYADIGTDCSAEFHLVDMPTQRGEEEKTGSAEAEAAFVARYIRDMLDSGFCVQTDRDGGSRPVRAEDIAILMRSPGTRIEGMHRALTDKGISCTAEADGGFYETMEVAVLFALLQVIDNPRQDVPLITVLRSPLFGFTPDRLAELRAAFRGGDYYDALCADGGEDCKAFLEMLHGLRELASIMPVHELLDRIYAQCHVAAVFGAMPDGARRKENLFRFAELTREIGGGSLFAFVSKLSALIETGDPPVPKGAQSGTGVRIMSIHKSKGLEFPVVILCDLAKRFNDDDLKKPVLVHPKYGIGPMRIDTVRSIKYPTMAHEALKKQLRREAKAEEMRLLYVAMTRAKEKLVMVHTQANASTRLGSLFSMTGRPVMPEAAEQASCLGDWVLLPLLLRPEARALRELAEIEEGVSFGVFEDAPWKVQVHDGLAQCGEKTEEQVSAAEKKELPPDRAALDFVYPHIGETQMPAKLTATQLKGREADTEIAENAALPPRLRALARPQFLTGEIPLSSAERGTALHAVMQYLDFSVPAQESAVREQIARLCERKLITPQQAESVAVDEICRFLESPLAERIRRAEKVEREYRFSILADAAEYDSAATSGDRLLLQGVADCFFEEGGALVIVDFKTDRVAPDTLAARAEYYRPQLDAYASALSRIMEMPVREKILYFFHLGESVEL